MLVSPQGYRMSYRELAPVSVASSPNSGGIHRSPITQTQPAAPNAIHQPERERDQDRHAHHRADNRDHQRPANERPQQREPERANLPAVMRVDPRTACVAALHVVQENGYD